MGGGQIASIVIPAFNEETTIGALIDQIKKFKEVKEIILVDDGCVDETARIAKKKGAKIIRHKKNLGKGKSIIDGVKKAKENIVILIDADLQHDPEDIPGFLKAIEKADMVIGERNYSKIPFHRKITNSLCSLAVWIGTRKKFSDVLCGYRCIRKDKFEEILDNFDGYEIELGMLKEAVKQKLAIKRISVKTRYMGKSKMRFRDFVLLSIYAIRTAL